MSNIFDLDSLVNKLHKGNIVTHNPFEINMPVVTDITGGKDTDEIKQVPQVSNSGDIPKSEWKKIPIGSILDYVTDYKKKPNDKVEPNNNKKNCKLVAIGDDGGSTNFVFKRGKYTWTAKGSSILKMSYSGEQQSQQPLSQTLSQPQQNHDIIKIADKVLSNDLLKERVDKIDDQLSKMSANILSIMNYIKKIKVENKLK
jgi:hypothetical protein